MAENTFNLLLVEDNPDHVELILRSFGEHKYHNTVRVVTDGQAALDYLFRRGEFEDAKRSPRPQVILLDLRLPRVDGLEVLKQIKTDENLMSIPVVVLTTSNVEKDKMGAYASWVNSYVVKPQNAADFSRLMQDLGNYWLGWNNQLDKKST